MAETATRFRAPWSPLLTLITGFTLALFMVLFIALPLILLVDGGHQALLPVSMVWVVTIGFFIWAFRTQFIRNYVLSENRLIVERFGSDTKFALGSLETVWEDPTAMNGIYVMTNGGLFAFSGKNCRNKKLGVFEAYATHKKRSVVLRFPNHILVVTPEDPTAFVKAVKAGMTVHRKSSDN